MDHIIINNKEEVRDIILRSSYLDLKSFLSDSHNVLYSRFDYEYFIFGKTISPNEIDDKSKKSENSSQFNIFQVLKKYGSSKKYKGVVNSKGEITIANNFTSIEPFWNQLVKVGVNGKFGVYNLNGKIICKVEFDEIYEMSEFVFGARKGSKIGFFNSEGNLVIPFEYDYSDEEPYYPIFSNGLACVFKIHYGYIDHYGTTIFPFKFSLYVPFDSNVIENRETINQGDGYSIDVYELGIDGSMRFVENDYFDKFNISEYEASLGPCYNDNNYDILDAYEGDESNMWNTD